ncbi:hypothetical protein [Chitinophaga sp. HK235]|uniref:hypothetical protein n=1 Tax=Chitinophaga sp. HK235 TaxID=2952571 RepID=UPI001BA9A839|nr:hypothetical protein [Chitinophaga sp. HK235]
MKKFLLKVFLFIFPLIALMYPLDILLSRGLKNANGDIGELEVMRDIYDGRVDCDIAVYGSSRAWVQINPAIIEDSLHKRVYNLGIDGHNFWLQYLRHLEYLKHNRKPGHIVMSVDAFTLQKRPDLYQLTQFMPYMLWNENIYRYTSSYEGFSKTDYFIPLMRYAGRTETMDMIAGSLRNDIPPYRQKGFRGMDMEWNDDFVNAKRNNGQYKIRFDTASIALFENFIKECSRNHIELVLFYAPEHIDGQRFIANRNELLKLYNQFSRKYNIPFFDFSNDELCFNKKYFYNTMHLNNKGADLFTARLAGRLKNLITTESRQ